MSEKTFRRGNLGSSAVGKRFIVVNDVDRDFPKGTVVTCLSGGALFSSERVARLYMLEDTLLKGFDGFLTFTELVAELGNLKVGQEIEVTYSSGAKNNSNITVRNHMGSTVLKWDGDTELQLNSITAAATYKLLPVEPKYLEITAIEAMQIVADGGAVYVDDTKFQVNKFTDFEAFGVNDMEDLLDFTTWYKKNK